MREVDERQQKLVKVNQAIKVNMIEHKRLLISKEELIFAKNI